MPNQFVFTTAYRLDKQHFYECYDQSSTSKPSILKYYKALILAILGFYFVIFSAMEPYVSWFIVALGFVDGLSVYYARSWWVGRQMLSKAAGVEVNLKIDSHAITSQSALINHEILWCDVSSLINTEQGWLIAHKGGKNYISSSCLSPEAETFLRAQAEQ